MTGRNAVIDLPELPFEPREFIFNDFKSVLCESEEEDWDNLVDD